MVEVPDAMADVQRDKGVKEAVDAVEAATSRSMSEGSVVAGATLSEIASPASSSVSCRGGALAFMRGVNTWLPPAIWLGLTSSNLSQNFQSLFLMASCPHRPMQQEGGD